LDCGGKRGATPLWSARGSRRSAQSPKAVSPRHRTPRRQSRFCGFPCKIRLYPRPFAVKNPEDSRAAPAGAQRLGLRRQARRDAALERARFPAQRAIPQSGVAAPPHSTTAVAILRLPMQNPPFIRARSRLNPPKIPAPLRLARQRLGLRRQARRDAALKRVGGSRRSAQSPKAVSPRHRTPRRKRVKMPLYKSVLIRVHPCQNPNKTLFGSRLSTLDPRPISLFKNNSKKS
jgi:hypothetical protein